MRLTKLFLTLCLIASMSGFAQTNADEPGQKHACGFDDYFHPLLERSGKTVFEFTRENWQPLVMQKSLTSPGCDDHFRIPVVFYCIHDGSFGFVSETRILSNLQVLNNDFAGSGIEFCLATEYNGSTIPLPTIGSGVTSSFQSAANPGIIWVGHPQLAASYQGATSSDHVTLTSLSVLPEDRYLRIFIVPDAHQGLGFSFLPGAAPFPGGDGIFMSDEIIGDASTCSGFCPSSYSLGHILTHEGGHFLNLLHIFEGGCAGTTPATCAIAGDLVCDTPPTNGNSGSNCSALSNPCGVPELAGNHMDYWEDACKNNFSQEQIMRMRQSLCIHRPSMVSPANAVYTGIQCADLSWSCDLNPSFIYNVGGNDCEVEFNDTSLPSPDELIGLWYWDFGDGTHSIDQNPIHTYSSPGTYNVCLLVVGFNNTTGNYCNCTYCDVVTIACTNPTCDVNACLSVTHVCSGTFNFDSSCSTFNGTATYLWDFFDGATSNLPNPSHTFSSGPTFISLTITNTLNGTTCSHTTYGYVTAPGPCAPVADFTWSNSSNCTVDFTNTSNPGYLFMINSYSWDFGDGSSPATSPNPSHTYLNPGTYNVCLSIVVSDGGCSCTDQVCYQVSVNCDGEGCLVSPAFTSTDMGGGSYTFNDATALVNSTVVVQYAWDFGDGTIGNGPNFNHTYSIPGVYLVCLTVTGMALDGSFCTQSVCETVGTTVQGSGSCIPENNFSYTPGAPCCVDFSALITDPTVPPTCIIWDFGDSSPTVSGIYDVTHCYASNGSYNVCLTNCCVNADGTTTYATYCQTVVVSNCCINPDFSWVESTPCEVEFTGPSCGFCSAPAIEILTWDFGDFTSASIPNPTHTYSGPGTYLVCLTLDCVDSLGAIIYSYTVCHNVTVTCGNGCTPCDPFFNASSLDGCCYNFTPIGCFSIPTYSCETWDFGDGSSVGGGASISHCYTDPGTYTVCHTTCCINADGTINYATFCRDVTCTCVPEDDFTYTFASPCCVDFSAIISDPTIPPSCIEWNFGYPTPPVTGVYDVTHCFPGNGFYNVCLTNCCTDPDGNVTTTTHCELIEITDCCACGPLVDNFFDVVVSDCCMEFVADVPDPTLPALPCVTWNFGDGSPLVTGSYIGNHCYTSPGTYTVCFTDCCENADGTFTSLTTCHDIVISGSCCCTDPDFTWVLDSDCIVQFTGPTCPDYTSVTWDFGDGGTYSGINPSYMYTSGGIFNVCMTVTCDPTGTGGTTTTVCHDVGVPCCSAGCDDLADFTWSTACNDVNFVGLDLGLLSGCWSWDFGDGTSGTGQLISHTYPGPGTYTACLTVCCFFNGWSSTTYCHSVTVDPCCDLLADFSWTNECETFTFTGIEIGQPSGCWFWNFGDGDLGTGTTVTHTFPAGGTYDVCLTVCCDDPITMVTYVQDYCYTIVVQPCCDLDADFYWTGTFPTIDFFGVDLGDPSGCWHWNFGDGVLGTGQYISHTYATPGTYTVCLDVCCDDYINQVTLIQTYCHTITIAGPCPEPCEIFAAFEHTTTAITASSSTIAFSNAVSTGSFTSGPLSYAWTFGDGGTSAAANPVHVYTTPGVYTVCLTATATTAAGLSCSDTYCFDIRVSCLGDLDNNGVVNVADILLLFSNYGLCY